MSPAEIWLAMAASIKERLAEGGGIWRTCSGCYESEDGYPNGYYPHSKVFNCTIGGGCSECGGLGAIWDTTDYAEMAAELSRQDSPSVKKEQRGAALAHTVAADDCGKPQTGDV